MDSIFYHEDFYRQIELIPEQNYFAAQKEIDDNKIINFSDNGFSHIREREDLKIKPEDLKIDVSAIQKALLPITIKFFKTVTTGYSTTTQLKKNTIAFGFERLALFVEANDSAIVKNVWLSQSIDLQTDAYCNNLVQALTILGTQFGLILIDWNEEVVVRLSSVTAIQDYLADAFAF